MHPPTPPDILAAIEATTVYRRVQVLLEVVDDRLEVGPRKTLTPDGRRRLAARLDEGADPDAMLALALRARLVRTLKGRFVRLRHAPTDPDAIWALAASGDDLASP